MAWFDLVWSKRTLGLVDFISLILFPTAINPKAVSLFSGGTGGARLEAGRAGGEEEDRGGPGCQEQGWLLCPFLSLLIWRGWLFARWKSGINVNFMIDGNNPNGLILSKQ